MVTSCHPDEDVDNPKHPDFYGREYLEKKPGKTSHDPEFLSAVGYEVWHILSVRPESS
jgi:hypothetical protein